MAELRKAPSRLTYRDALRILGADDAPFVRVLDKLLEAGVSLADTHAAGLLSLFGMKDDIVARGHGALTGLSDRLAGLSRLDRSERIYAAHAVLVITSLFGAFDDEDTGVPSELRFVLEGDIPAPSARWPLEEFASVLKDWYARFGQPALVDRAVRGYLESFRRLAADVPEFALWAAMTDAQATRATTTRGFDRLAELVRSVGDAAKAQQAWAELGDKYRSQVSRRILNPEDAPQGIVLPTYRDSFVTPNARLWTGKVTAIADEHGWRDARRIDDVQRFLAGHLASYAAIESPLLLLGQPGSGKSMITRMLASALIDTSFLPLRVELRDVAARDLRSQLAEAVFNTIDRRVDWRDLMIAANGALPVIMLDGFDELLQATGTNDADYLLRLRDFQLDQLEMGQPVAIIVTSRTSVANRATVPQSSTVLRLESFDEARVRDWLARWSSANAAVLAQRGLTPLSAEAALAQGEPAGEPLLLLMLALFDADGNALQRRDSSLTRAELYERLLKDFALREVRKHHANLPRIEAEREAERELLRLSVTALGMFNRGQQSISERELDDDLRILLPNDAGATPEGAGSKAAFTPAQALVGRFFFIHEPRARQATGEIDRCFEFSHATFGEYLVARLVVGEVVELAKEQESASRRPIPRPLDTSFLRTMLSFELLSGRDTVTTFCDELFAARPGELRQGCRELLVDLLRSSLTAGAQSRYDEYSPATRPVPERYAAWSANLVLLAVYATGSALDVRDVVDDMTGDSSANCSTHAAWSAKVVGFWNSQLRNTLSLVDRIRTRYVSPSDLSALTVLLEPEHGQLVSFSECAPRGRADVEHTDAMLGFPTQPIMPDSEVGRLLRRAAWGLYYFYEIEGLAAEVGQGRVWDMLPNGLTTRALLHELALAPPEGIPLQRRAAMYGAIFANGGSREVRAAMRLLATDLATFESAQLTSLLRRFFESGGAQKEIQIALLAFLDTLDPERQQSFLELRDSMTRLAALEGTITASDPGRVPGTPPSASP